MASWAGGDLGNKRVASEDKWLLAGLLALSSSLSREQDCGCAYSEVAIPAPASPGIIGEQCCTMPAKPLVQAHIGTVSACAVAETALSPLWSARGRGYLPTPCHQTHLAAALFPWSRDRHLDCSGSSSEGWEDVHTQGDLVQGSSLPDSAACSSPKLQPCTCRGAKAMQLSQRKPMKREMWWQRSKKGVADELLKQMGISRSKRQRPGSTVEGREGSCAMDHAAHQLCGLSEEIRMPIDSLWRFQ